MPEWNYTARSKDGNFTDGVIDADNVDEARRALAARELEVSKLVPAQSWQTRYFPFLNAEVRARIRPVPLAALTGQLSLMLRTGTSLVEGLDALAEQDQDPNVAGTLKAIRTDVTSGMTLSAALAAHPESFDGFYVSAVKAGEASGRLAPVFKQLEAYLRKRIEVRANIVTSMIYPLIISIMAVGAVIFIMTFVLPNFITIFKNSNVQLPLPTRMLMAISAAIAGYWYLWLTVIGGIVFGFMTLTRSPVGKAALDNFMLRAPLVGPVVIMIQSALLLRTLGTLLGAGVPLLDSLEVARDACANSRFKQLVSRVISSIIQGETLAYEFSRSDLMTPAIKQMVTTGERSGSLAMVMEAIADNLDETGEKQLKRVSTIIEPVVLLGMGIVIGFIAVSVLLPLFRLTSAVH